jgi:ABC-type phosphate transport system permease subunit
MPSQYEIDTQFMKFLLNICFIISIFSIAFLTALIPSGIGIKLVQSLYVLFMMIFVMFLGVVIGIFIKWYGKYKTSLFKFR